MRIAFTAGTKRATFAFCPPAGPAWPPLILSSRRLRAGHNFRQEDLVRRADLVSEGRKERTNSLWKCCLLSARHAGKSVLASLCLRFANAMPHTRSCRVPARGVVLARIAGAWGVDLLGIIPTCFSDQPTLVTFGFSLRHSSYIVSNDGCGRSTPR